MNVVLILRQKDMKDIVHSFSLQDIHSFVQASNIENQAAFSFFQPNILLKQTSHLIISSPKLQLLQRYLQVESQIIAIEFANCITVIRDNVSKTIPFRNHFDIHQYAT